jgi:hypothetical protein
MERFEGRASLPEPTTAIPYNEPTLVMRPPPRRGRGMFVAGLICAGVIVLAFGALAGYAFKPSAPPQGASNAVAPQRADVPPSPTATPDSPRAAAEKFLAAALDGNQAAMQAQLCNLLKQDDQKNGKGGLGLGLFVSYKVGEEHVTGPAGSVDVQLTVPIVGDLNFDLYMVHEAEGWRVCGGGPGS